MIIHSSILAWRIPCTEEPGGLQSMGSWRVRHDWSNSAYTAPVSWFPWGFLPQACHSLALILIPLNHSHAPATQNKSFPPPFLGSLLLASYPMGWDLPRFSSVQLLSRVRLFVTPWTAAHKASLSITNSQSLLKLMYIASVMPFNHLILCHPLLLCLQSFPESGSFPMSQFFTTGGQSNGVSASASVLPINIQDWFPLGWTGWISLQSKGLSRVFSNTTVQKHQFFGTQLSL